MRRLTAAVAALAVAALLVGCAPARPGGTVDVQVLAVNDFHGHLEPASGAAGEVEGTAAGGVEYLATHIRARKATNPNTVVVSAGDLIGASPLLSALFHDEPTIEAMNTLGLDLGAVGNHEFDEGADELRRMRGGGCHPTDGCAKFGFLAANVIDRETGETLFPPYAVRDFNGVKVAFVGMTLEATPTMVTPRGVAGLEFRDEADTVNALVPELQQQGVEAIVVLLHEGGATPGGFNECPGISGPIVDIVGRMSDAVDVVVSGHTHQAYNCRLDGKLVTSAGAFGRLVTAIELTVDRARRDVVSARAANRIVTRDVDRAADLRNLIARYAELAIPVANRVIGTITTDLTRADNTAGESALGTLLADAQLSATAGPGAGGAVVAFINPGGIRADLTVAPSGSEAPGEVTYGEAFAVQPFGNNLVTLTLTGAQIDALLEQQWCGQPSPRVLHASHGLSYAWNASRPPCEDRVDASTITIGGVPVDPASRYRVTVNSFLADGGDNFTVLAEGTDRLVGALDLDALEAYLSTPLADRQLLQGAAFFAPERRADLPLAG
ncbi:MAG: bifunctional metallophosphatase/5'-nucleotidase [Egibacteraceae bacterium]